MNFTLIKNFDTPFANDIANIMIQQWGYNYRDGFKYKSIDEYKLWKKDTLVLIATTPATPATLAGMIAYEEYNMADMARWSPCLCCLWVDPSIRQKGLGTELLIRMTDICRELPTPNPQNPRKDLYIWFLDPTLISFFEKAKWRYLIEWNYLNRKVHIMYRDLRND